MHPPGRLSPSDEAQLALSSASAGGRPALRMDFDFKGGAGLRGRPVPGAARGVRGLRGHVFGCAAWVRPTISSSSSSIRAGRTSGGTSKGICSRPRAGSAFASTAARSSSPGVRRAAASSRSSERSRSPSSRAKVAPGRYGSATSGSRITARDWRAGERFERAAGLRCRPGARRVRLDAAAPMMRSPGSPSTSPRRAGSAGSSSIGGTAHRRAAFGCEHRRAVGVGGRCTRRRVRAARAATSTCRT